MTGASAGMGASSSALFDGGGMTATAPGTCAASATASAPLASSMGPGSSVGPVGIPLGSTEIAGGGISPPSVALNPNPSAPVVSLLGGMGRSLRVCYGVSRSDSQSTATGATQGAWGHTEQYGEICR